jgi:dGTPase
MTAPRLNWQSLLSTKRIRRLVDTQFQTIAPAPPNADHRPEFQRDFDRLVFSSPVRRLQDKAQVFPLDPCDSVRTRLTHSLEVSSVAKGIAGRCARSLVSRGEISEDQREQIETIAAAAGLAHDLGNPPFGHFGETAIQGWFAEKYNSQPTGDNRDPFNNLRDETDSDIAQLRNDLLHFEGNAHTVRLIGNLQILGDRSGLNFTAATMSACIKYLASSSNIDKSVHAYSKPGYKRSEEHIVAAVQTETGTTGCRHPIAIIVEAADDCVYSLCDIEDAVKKGILSWRELKDQFATHGKSSEIDQLLNAAERNIAERSKAAKIDLKDSTDDACAQMFRVYAARRIVEDLSSVFLNNYSEIMNGTYHNELRNDPDAGVGGKIVKAAKKIGAERIYSTRENIELELRGRAVICGLLDLLYLGAQAWPSGDALDTRSLAGKAFNLLSHSYRIVAENDLEHFCPPSLSRPAWEQYQRLLLISDYVAGMTDSFACTLHRQLFNG